MDLATLNKQDVGLSGINVKGVKVTKMYDFKPSKTEGWAGRHGIMCSDDSGKALININTKEPLSSSLNGATINILGIKVEKGFGEYPLSFYGKEVEIVNGHAEQAPASSAPPPASKPADSHSPAQARTEPARDDCRPPTLDSGIGRCVRVQSDYLQQFMKALDDRNLGDVKTAFISNPTTLQTMCNTVLMELGKSGALYRDESPAPKQAPAQKQVSAFGKAALGIRDECGAKDSDVTDAIGTFGFTRLGEIPADKQAAFLTHLRAHLNRLKAPAPVTAPDGTSGDDDLPF